MKTKRIFITIIFLLVTFMSLKAQTYSYELRMTNYVQVSEMQFEYDLDIRNNAVDPVTNAWAYDNGQTMIQINSALMNGGVINDTYTTLSNSTSDLPITQQLNLNSYLFWSAPNTALATSSPSIGDGDDCLLLNDNSWKRITHCIVKLRNSINSQFSNFASVSPNFTFLNSNCIIFQCPYTDNGSGGYMRTGSSSIITNKTFTLDPSCTHQMASHYMNITGNFSLNSNWNNSVGTLGVGYHTLPISTDNVIIAVSGATLTTNQTVNDLTIKSTSTLTMNAGTQLSVDGSLYNDNATAGALTLKADGGVHPTASLKNNTASVTATVENYLPAWGNDVGWHLLASPVNAQAIAPNFIDATLANYDFFSYNPADVNCWVNQKGVTFSDTIFQNGIGYLVSYANGATHNFAGTMHNADLSLSLNAYNSPGTLWNLIGNPYPCALDGNISGWAKSNLNNVVYVLDGPTNTYKYWNGDGEGNLPNGEIPAMQGFFVNSIAAGTASITISANAKKHSNHIFYKSSLSNKLSLNLVSPNTTNDATIIYFKNTNSNSVDMNDALLMPSGNPQNTQIYSYINFDKYCINALGAYTSPISVNLGFEPKVNGNFTLTAGDIQSFNLASHIYLQDLKTNTTQDLRSNPTYTFAADITDNVNRFTIFFDLVAEVGIPTTTAKNNGIYSFGDKLYLPTIEKLTTVSIYNMLGQEVVSSFHPTSNIFTVHQPEGYYIVRVIANQNVITQKIYIK
ncbi:MAG: T9SS type A sorting domain-containing protein [Bacteroidales bacterium]